MFDAQHLHKRFGHQVVLEDVTMRFEAGRLSGIMGPNGAGKTTCFNLLTGRYAPDRGRITFEGRDITGLPPRKIARMGISRSFQIMNLFDDYTALDNVLMATPEVRERGFSMLGAVLFFVARDLLGAYTEAWLLWYGLLFMAIVLFKPEGLAGLWTGWRARRHAARVPAQA